MKISSILEKVVGDLDDKKRWRAYKARTKQLPSAYRDAIDALERYLMYYGAIAKGDVLVKMLDDLGDLFEQAAADRTPIRSIVGDDPVGFAEEFVRNYTHGQWINKERARPTEAIDRAVAEESR